ncbi:hypothetical protein GCM10025858_12550 [Alicyclobacillus sacchari]|nr:hypothetical protein GCM10025858_12550 [Alicyclobacillus sacchari]
MEQLTIAGKSFRSRLMVGTGKYASLAQMREALAASNAEIVTVAVRRVNLDAREESILSYIDLNQYTLLPNTAGCHTAEEAIRTARLARAAGLSNWVKLEVIPNDGTLLPDPIATVEAAEQLVKEGFVVLPYTTDDHTVARRLLDVGCATIMPFASAIGTGQGLRAWIALRELWMWSPGASRSLSTQGSVPRRMLPLPWKQARTRYW